MLWLYIVCMLGVREEVHAEKITVKGERITVKGKRLGTGEEYQFNALQCDNARTLARYSGRSFCDVETIRKDNGVPIKTEGGEYSVLQLNPVRKFKAIRCEKKISSLTAVCGAFSHSKLVEPPDVLKPVPVPKQDCIDVSQTKLVTTEDGRQLRAGPGVTATYKYIETGSVTLSDNNVACEGGEMRVKGKPHESLIKLVTVTFKVTEVDVTEENGRLRVSDGQLPRSCSLEYEGCALDDMTLVIDPTKVNMCPYTEVRRAKFKMFRFQGKDMAENDEAKLLFQLNLNSKAVLPKSCVLPGNMIKTNFDRLFLLPGGVSSGNILGLFDASTVDLDLESRVTDFYMEYWSWALVKESNTAWQSEICALSADRLNEDQMILHGDHLLRMKGELIHEFKCEWVIVTARAGFKAEGDRCLDHLPVFTGSGEPAYLAPLTRLLAPRSAVSVLNCSANFPVAVEDVQRRMIAANPAVGIVDVALSEYHSLDFNSQNHTELFEVRSLLYTPEEIHDYEMMLLGPSSERAVTKQFSSYYCQASGECSPTRDTQDFRWNRLLQDPESAFTWWWDDLKDWLLWWGAVWGCVSCGLTVLSFLFKILTIMCHLGRTDLDKKTLVKFVFMPGNELVNLFPGRPRNVRMPFAPARIEKIPEGETLELQKFQW